MTTDSSGRTTETDRVYRAIRDAIVDGDLPEGEALSHVALARRFGVSRIPVREALQRLEAERLLVSRPYRGHRVPSLDLDELEELIEIRILLECLALRRHASTFGPEVIEELRQLNHSLAEEDDPTRWLHGDWDLHRKLAGDDTPSAEFTGDVRRRIHRYLNAAGHLGERHIRAVEEHERVLAALADGDVELAETHLRHHIESTGKALVAFLRGR
jgi:DNA-binding GntR family transcriptional regulator